MERVVCSRCGLDCACASPLVTEFGFLHTVSLASRAGSAGMLSPFSAQPLKELCQLGREGARHPAGVRTHPSALPAPVCSHSTELP